MGGGGRGPENLQREKLVIGQWVARRYPKSRVWLNQQIGPVIIPPGFNPQTPTEYSLAKVTRRRADAIVVTGSEVVIAEAKVKPDGKELGQLLVYRILFRATPEFSEFTNLPVRLHIVVAVHDEIIRHAATLAGITYELFDSPQIREMLRTPNSQGLRHFQAGFSASKAALEAVR